MHDERADHAHHFLHGHVRVIEERAFLVQREFVSESAAGRNRFLGNAWRAVHIKGNFEAVPVHRSGLGQVVIDDDAHAIALVHLNRGAGRSAVVTPEVHDLAGKNCSASQARR